MCSLQKANLEEIRKAGSRICRDYLTGKWKEVSPDDLIVKRISGGLSNFLYYISLPHEDNDTSGSEKIDTQQTEDDLMSPLEHFPLQQKEPKEVLLRVYGQTHGGDALENVITESVVFTLLSERNFGPKLYGIFPGGRLEQFINARPLLTKELAIPSISKKVAEKMGEIHSLNIPMSKEPDWLFNCMARWLKGHSNIIQMEKSTLEQEEFEFVKKFNYIEEIEWLRRIIDNENFPVFFCHNDMQEGNILLREKNDSEPACDGNANQMDEEDNPDLIIIDFEYCAYNYRGFDLANHFIEWTIDYSYPQFPFYSHKQQQFPNKEQRKTFIRNYLIKFNEDRDKSAAQPTEEEIEQVDYEVTVFSMFSHLFWSLWSIVNVTSNIEFGYWEYAVSRIKEFLRLKEDFSRLKQT